jgi:hypothetical protein
VECAGDSYNMLCAENRKEEMNERQCWAGRLGRRESRAECCVSRKVEVTVGSFDAMVPRVSATRIGRLRVSAQVAD